VDLKSCNFCKQVVTAGKAANGNCPFCGKELEYESAPVKELSPSPNLDRNEHLRRLVARQRTMFWCVLVFVILAVLVLGRLIYYWLQVDELARR